MDKLPLQPTGVRRSPRPLLFLCDSRSSIAVPLRVDFQPRWVAAGFHGAIKTLESPVLSRRNILPVGLHEKARREAGLMVLWQRSVVAPLLRHFLGLSPQQIIPKLARAR